MTPHKKAINTPLSEIVFRNGADRSYTVNLPGLPNYKGQPLYCHMTVAQNILFLNVSDQFTEDQPVSGTPAGRVSLTVSLEGVSATDTVNMSYDGSNIEFGVQVSPDMSTARLSVRRTQSLGDSDSLLRFIAIQDDLDAAWYNLAWIDPPFIFKDYRRLLDAGAALVLPWDDAMDQRFVRDDDGPFRPNTDGYDRGPRGGKPRIQPARRISGGGSASGPIGFSSP